MCAYEPNMTFEAYMESRNEIAETRDEALSKNAIAELVEADLALARIPSLELPGPHTKDDVTTPWLTKILGGAVPGAALEHVGMDNEHSGMTDRRLLKLKWNVTGAKAGLPDSVFVKATPSSVDHRESLAIFHMSAIEVRFYQLLRPELPTLAPEAYYACSYPGGRFLLLLQDLTEMGCRPYWLGDECSIEHARGVVIALAQLHARFWESERFTRDLAWVRPRTHRYGWPWQHHSFLDSRSKYLQSEEGKSMPADFSDLLQKWIQYDTTVYHYLDQRPGTVLHGDCHLGNTFGYPDGSAGLFDWQVMFRGSGLRDFTYFLLSALTNDQRCQYEKELFELYLSHMAEAGVVLDKPQAWQEYCLFAFDQLDACVKTIVRATYGHAKHGLNVRNIMIALMDHDVPGMLNSLIRHGKL